MDLQTFSNFKSRFIFEVIGKSDPMVSLKSVRSFIDSINVGDILIVECPLRIDTKSGGGVKCYSIKVYNTKTSKPLSMKATDLFNKIFRWIEVNEIYML